MNAQKGKVLRRKILYHFLLVVISFIFGVILVNFTEPLSERVAHRIVSLITHGRLSPHSLDDNGVPRLYYSHLSGSSCYNPVYVAMYGLYYYNQYLETGTDVYFLKYYDLYPPKYANGSDKWRELFLSTANWFVENGKRRQYKGIDFTVWEYDFPWDYYSLKRGWVSGMAQGLAIQVLLRAFMMTKDERYLNVAYTAAKAFYVPVESSGVTRKLSDHAWWYEEYAAPGAQESLVLNGHEHVLLSLREAYTITGDPLFLDLFNKGIKALINRIDLYSADKICWTYYDAIGTLANRKYHHINISLTKALYALTGEHPLLTAYTKWMRCRNSPLIYRELHRRPISERFLIMVFINVGFIWLLLIGTPKTFALIRKAICRR